MTQTWRLLMKSLIRAWQMVGVSCCSNSFHSKSTQTSAIRAQQSQAVISEPRRSLLCFSQRKIMNYIITIAPGAAAALYLLIIWECSRHPEWQAGRFAKRARPAGPPAEVSKPAAGFLPNKIRTAKTKRRRAASSRHIEIWRGKEIKMEYLIVLATMLMIAGYACIIGRFLRQTE